MSPAGVQKTSVYYPAEGTYFAGTAAGLGTGDTYAAKPGNNIAQAEKGHEAVLVVGQLEKNEPIEERIGYWVYETFDIPPGSVVDEAVWEWEISNRTSNTGTDDFHWRTGVLLPDERFDNQQRHARHPLSFFYQVLRDTAGAVMSYPGFGINSDIALDVREDRGMPEIGNQFRINTGVGLPNNLILASASLHLIKVGPARAANFNTYAELYDWVDDSAAQQAIFEAAPLATSDVMDWNAFPTSSAEVVWTFSGDQQITLPDVADYVCIWKNLSAGTSYVSVRAKAEHLGSAPLTDAVTLGAIGERTPYFSQVNYLSDHLFPNMMAEDDNTTITAPFVGGTVFPSNTTHYAIPWDTFVDTWTMGDSSIVPTPDFDAALGAKLQALFAHADYGDGAPNAGIKRRLVAMTMCGIDDGVTLIDIDSENATLGAKLTITYTPPALDPSPDPDPLPPHETFNPSETTIANAALILLGEHRIDSLNDGNKTASMIAERYSELRDSLLRLVPWTFATKRARIAQDAVGPLWEFGNAFTPPLDFIRLLTVDNEFTLPYRVEEGKVVTNMRGPLDIIYTARITNVALMDILYRDALAAYIAMELAEAITGSSEKLAQVSGIFRQRFAEAVAANGQENLPRQIQFSEHESSRGRLKD